MEYQLTWRNKWLTADAGTIDDMIDSLREATDGLKAMKARGVSLDPGWGVEDDYATLVTTDPAVAEEFGFEAVDHDEDGAGPEEAEQGVAGVESVVACPASGEQTTR